MGLSSLIKLVRAIAVLALFFAWQACGNPPLASILADKEYGISATVVILPPEENRGFSILDVPQKRDGDNIRVHWQTNFALMCNGGFFDTTNFNPAAFCRLKGKTIHGTVSPRWSGFVAINPDGKLHLLWRGADLAPYPWVLQAGPYVIDPGGRIGIKSRADEKARRTLVGLTDTREVVFMITQPVHLYDLARAVKKHLPRIERLLNLDGGPSTGFKTETAEILNEWPVRNYLVKQ